MLGASLVEVSLLLAFIAVVSVSAARIVGKHTKGRYCNSLNALVVQDNTAEIFQWDEVQGVCFYMVDSGLGFSVERAF